MPFIWGSGSTWKILIRSPNTTVRKAESPCTEDKAQPAVWFAKGHPSALGSQHRGVPATAQPGPSSAPPHHSLLSLTQDLHSHTAQQPLRLRSFPMEGSLPAGGSCVNCSSPNPTALHRHNCSLKPKQTLAASIKCCAWKAGISYSIKGLKSPFQPCLIT